MTDTPLATRALFALYRNHPSTRPDERYGQHAHHRALQNREMLLAWAATQSDGVLLSCRNLGVTSLAWIRANQPHLAWLRHVHEGEWCAPCVEHGFEQRKAAQAVVDAFEPKDGSLMPAATRGQWAAVDALRAALGGEEGE